ncbi:hypothetical protein [uncultured Tateyamaria sp.]|uniref:hypothetical protein n=1 Tax=uncultured Tateyamaria sp. TaxID=455651 RepID=UPI00260F0E83|nr:hypothetical protein [uncultured Tateyamaria sp.]
MRTIYFLLIAYLFLVDSGPAAAADWTLTAVGTAEFYDSDKNLASNVLDESVSEALRQGFNAHWMKDTEMPVARILQGKEGFSAEKIDQDDWSRLHLQVSMVPPLWILEDELKGVYVEVYVKVAGSRHFYGEEEIRGNLHNAALSMSFNDRPFELVMDEMLSTDQVYDQAVDRLGAAQLSRRESLEIVESLIRIYKIRGKHFYLNDLTRAIGRYLEHGHELPTVTVEFLQNLRSHTHFVRLSEERRAEKLHAFAFELKNAKFVNQALEGTNSQSTLAVAKTLLDQIEMPDLPSIGSGEELAKEFQRTLVLDLELTCLEDETACLDKMATIRSIDARHPINRAHMKAMVQTYLTVLTDMSKIGAAPGEARGVFVERVSNDEFLPYDWNVLYCIAEQNDGRLRKYLRQDRSMQREFGWADDIQAISKLPCDG